MIIDSHFHYLSMLEKDKNASLAPDLVGLEIGLDGGDMHKRIEKIGKNRNIFLSVGAGPWVLDRSDFVSIDHELYLLENDIKKYGADAIGEIGFDNYWNYGTKERQQELFIKQIQLARKYNIPVSIHSRDANKELLDACKKGYVDEKTIMHCFSSDKDVLKHLLDKGAYISFTGNVTYKSNSIIKESAIFTPLEKILVETDSPYLSPVAMRGKPNRPENTEYIIDFIATSKSIDREKLKERILMNFYALMGRDKSIVKRDLATL